MDNRLGEPFKETSGKRFNEGTGYKSGHFTPIMDKFLKTSNIVYCIRHMSLYPLRVVYS